MPRGPTVLAVDVVAAVYAGAGGDADRPRGALSDAFDGADAVGAVNAVDAVDGVAAAIGEGSGETRFDAVGESIVEAFDTVDAVGDRWSTAGAGAEAEADADAGG